MQSILAELNRALDKPIEANIFALFDRNGYIRFNMLYASPLALRHFKTKLYQYGLRAWYFTENELIFELSNMCIIFRGTLNISYNGLIFALEFDFDPIIPDDRGLEFLCDIETFLKKCDAVFFMTYFISIDTEILSQPLSKSIDYLLTRK